MLHGLISATNSSKKKVGATISDTTDVWRPQAHSLRPYSFCRFGFDLIQNFVSFLLLTVTWVLDIDEWWVVESTPSVLNFVHYFSFVLSQISLILTKFTQKYIGGYNIK
jgi:hypothetical protein